MPHVCASKKPPNETQFPFCGRYEYALTDWRSRVFKKESLHIAHVYLFKLRHPLEKKNKLDACQTGPFLRECGAPKVYVDEHRSEKAMDRI